MKITQVSRSSVMARSKVKQMS